MSFRKRNLLICCGVLVICLADFSSLEYIGCYVDNKEDRGVMGAKVDNDTYMSLEFCQSYCLTSTSYTYYATQFAHECFCGDDYAKHGRAQESDCNTPCAGEPAQKCGSEDRNSVYTVCSKGRFGAECGRQCHCKDDVLCTRSGICSNSQCADGWIGTTCSDDQDECASDATNRCQQNCHNKLGGYECTCDSGYQLAADGRSCLAVSDDFGMALDEALGPWRRACIALSAILVLFIIAAVITVIVCCRRISSRESAGRYNHTQRNNDISHKDQAPYYVNDGVDKNLGERGISYCAGAQETYEEIDISTQGNTTRSGDTSAQYTNLTKTTQPVL